MSSTVHPQTHEQHAPKGHDRGGEMVTRGRWRTIPETPTTAVPVGQLGDALDALDGVAHHRIMLCGGVVTSGELACALSTTATGVRGYPQGGYPVIRTEQASEIGWAAQWCGADCDPDSFDRVWSWLRTQIKRVWDDRADLLSTPQQTGTDLWLRTIPPRGWAVLDEPTQALLRSTTGQGRMETLPGAGAGVAHLYDSNLAYGAVLGGLPIGQPVDVRGDGRHGDPYTRGRFDVAWSAPAHWGRRPGILPEQLDDGSWSWPMVGRGWCDGSELAIAERFGWSTTVHRSLIYEHRADPFRLFNDRLRRIMERRTELGPAALFARRAVRNLLIHPIGALHGSARKVAFTAPAASTVGDSSIVPGTVQLDGDQVTAQRWAPVLHPSMSHPEWTTTIWARTRARLLYLDRHDSPASGALTLPEGSVIAFRNDAILTTCPVDWADAGRVGQYRLVGSAPFDRWPRSNPETSVIRKRCDPSS